MYFHLSFFLRIVCALFQIKINSRQTNIVSSFYFSLTILWCSFCFTFFKSNISSLLNGQGSNGYWQGSASQFQHPSFWKSSPQFVCLEFSSPNMTNCWTLKDIKVCKTLISFDVQQFVRFEERRNSKQTNRNGEEHGNDLLQLKWSSQEKESSRRGRSKRNNLVHQHFSLFSIL